MGVCTIVLILVLLENALREVSVGLHPSWKGVLILVLLENALRGDFEIIEKCYKEMS